MTHFLEHITIIKWWKTVFIILIIEFRNLTSREVKELSSGRLASEWQ